uniref:Uncharacterized protein n=1 Tax=Oryza sativa subsp. japonica TaxID=39947 RepID=Q5JJL9_ORYSJ|nr:hypothetical protein [Oryza sativa Japonica Group]
MGHTNLHSAGSRGSGRLSPRGRNGSGPTPRGDRGRGGHVTVGPDPPEGVGPLAPGVTPGRPPPSREAIGRDATP